MHLITNRIEWTVANIWSPIRCRKTGHLIWVFTELGIEIFIISNNKNEFGHPLRLQNEPVKRISLLA